MRFARVIAWCGAASLVVLAARTLSYALAPPSVIGGRLEAAAGGPRLVSVALVSVALAVVASCGVVGAAVFAVRERLLLTSQRVLEVPRLEPARIALRFIALWAATSVGFALFESYLHWRAGLGWHGLHCLLGPVHRDAVPLLAALSAVAVALVTALEHVVAWVRRTITRLRACVVAGRRPLRAAVPVFLPRAKWVGCAPTARGPPGFVVFANVT